VQLLTIGRAISVTYLTVWVPRAVDWLADGNIKMGHYAFFNRTHRDLNKDEDRFVLRRLLRPLLLLRGNVGETSKKDFDNLKHFEAKIGGDFDKSGIVGEIMQELVLL
jgi:hypothetical protein